MSEWLEAFPVTIEIPVAWGEMDAFQHVNNVVYFRYFESARIAYFERVGYRDLLAETNIGPILASTHCTFKVPLRYPDTVRVGARVTELGEDRFTMEYLVVSEQQQRKAAEGGGVVVIYDYGAQRKAPMPKVWRERIQQIEASPGEHPR